MRAPSVRTFSPENVSLTAPVGSLMRPTNGVAPEDTLERAASELHRNGGGVLPLVSDGILVAALTERSLALALLDGVDRLAPCSVASIPGETIAPYATGAEALRRFAESDGLPLIVVDDLGRPMGMLAASDLYPRRRQAPRPSMVGGMATPFGVYLTNGAVTGGASGFGLVCTGALLSTLFLTAALLLDPLFPVLTHRGLSDLASANIVEGGSLLLFLLLMRIAPLSGTHGAEHMVVHALERGEELTLDVVRRMPRVHPRCGTNIAAGASLFLGLQQSQWIPWQEVRVFVAMIATLMLWRPLGSFLQLYVTTKRPTDAQLKGAIRAAEQLMDNYSRSRLAVPSIPQRLWRTGLLHVMAGSMGLVLLVQGLSSLFGWNLLG